MKKLIMGLFLTFSILTMAGDFDYLEDKLELKYPVITDSQNNTMKIDDFDIGVFNNIIYIKMEAETFSGDGGWSKFDKQSYDKIATDMANYVRTMLNSNNKVEITLMLDKKIGDDELLHNGLY